VFPFHFTDATIEWSLLVRIVLGLAIIGAAVGLFLRCISLLTEALR
jgi:multisubunit Na+/H+ antiporter MnhC subunit